MPLPISVILISLNEAHHMDAVLKNLSGWAEKVFLVDSFSVDDTVDIALAHGVHVVQRRFRDFGDQWNYALENLPVDTPWTMKIDPDERLSDDLKSEIASVIQNGAATGYAFNRRLWFMGRPMPVRQPVVRIWRTGKCRFSDVIVNEHPIVAGDVETLAGEMEHHDSPNLHHWFDKQNKYITAEAMAQFRGDNLSVAPRLTGSALERRMWLKQNFWRLPGRFILMQLYFLFGLGAWRAGKVGWIWSRLRTDLYRSQQYKLYEMQLAGSEYAMVATGTGTPHPGAIQADAS
mgnify:CR=1 FL=1